MTNLPTRKVAFGVLLVALTASVCVAQVSAAATSRTATTNSASPNSTYRIRQVAYFQYPRMYPYANSTLRTTFVSGGATLPALGYEGATAKTSNPSTPTAGSAWAYFMSVLTSNHVTIQYCQTGSGFGKKVYDGLTGATGGVNGPCPALGTSPGTTNGFGAPASLALTDPDMAASDSPLTQAEYSTFVTNKASTRGEPTELPEIVGAVSMFYNNPDTGSTQINLTDSQICGMVKGTITNWSQLGFPSRTLQFVYRSDGSGTTFSFSNHLLAVCGSGSGLNTSQQFFDSTGAKCPCVVSAAPPGSIGASGNAGVASTIVATTGSIGYAEAANAQDSRVPSSGINFALVNGKDPIKNLPEQAAKISSVTGVAKDSVVVTAGGPASVAALSPPPVHAGCVLLVKPSAYANLSGGYPIIAVSYHLYAYLGNGANKTNLRTLAQELTKSGIVYNNQSGTKSITTIDKATTTTGTGTTGYSTLPSSFQSPILTASNACINS